jgi:dUTP pyrophosphatase
VITSNVYKELFQLYTLYKMTASTESNMKGLMKTLMICIDDVEDETIKQTYYDAVERYNVTVKDMFDNNVHDMCLDSGFDLYAPYSIMYDTGSDRQIILNHEVQARVVDDFGVSYPYYLYPRSSISKTNFRLANSVGIIDSGYRGSLIAKFDVVQTHVYEFPNMIQQGQRYTQICANDLVPFKKIVIVNKDTLGMNTQRGTGGFGSTG